MPSVPSCFVVVLSAFLLLNHVIALLYSTFYRDVRLLGLIVAFLPTREFMKFSSGTIVPPSQSPVRRGYRQSHTITRVVANSCHNLN